MQVGDGVPLHAADQLKFDAIFVDGYDHRARPGKLESLDVLPGLPRSGSRRRACWSPTSFGRVRGHGQTKRHLRDVFGEGLVLLPSPDSKNVLVSAFADPPAPVRRRNCASAPPA